MATNPHDVLINLLSANSQWAEDVEADEPGFFQQSAKGQAPHHVANDQQTLWIGCADSRVPESVITGARPGEIFVHRNIANQFPLDDVSSESVLAYAVDHLGVQHVVVVGHTECGGAAACLNAAQRPTFPEDGPVLTIPSLPYENSLNRWLEPLTTLAGSLHLSTTPKEEALPVVVVENVKMQVENLSKTPTLVNAWSSDDLKKRNVWLHGWIYNLGTGLLEDLKGVLGLPQDLVDWLAPTLQVSQFLSKERRAPDIVAVGFQELLPLHLGLSGFSKAVIENRNALILSQIEANAPNKERFSLIAKVVNAGVALLVYGRDETVSRTVCDVDTTWTGSGPAYMGNKGAVGIRFRVPGSEGNIGETFTFVCAHLAAHEENLATRLADYQHIVGTLLFPPVAPTESKSPSTIYNTSHLFFLGDLNFRLEIPPQHPLALPPNADPARVLDQESIREQLKEFDQLLVERRKGTVLQGLHEGEFWKFKCSYKYVLGEVDKYSPKRIPSWTDRVLYATHTDSPDILDKSNITNVLYTSIPGYTTSDHKPIVCMLLLPPTAPADAPADVQVSKPPMLRLPSTYTPVADPRANLKRYVGRSFDRIIGICWYILVLLGAGSGVVGVFNFIIGVGAWTWWKSKDNPPISV
ncbi:hypothetical protein DXG01_008995 [Tephrocybe rancida]|nr:hypothetical protein DXG01_008995 [Tephrocybe rancida]